MYIRSITYEEVQGFVDCYIQIFRTLKGIIPYAYVESQIEKASSPEFFKHLLKESNNKNNILLVSTINENIVGMARGKIMEDGSGWLGFIGVLQNHRRMGIGRALVKRFVEECTDRGSRKISLNTEPGLIPAIKLYESLGFIKEGFIKNPYGLELILYSKKITHSNP